MYPILASMAAWGERWLTGPEGTPLVLHHTTCDHDMHAVVVCSECDEPLDVRQIRAKSGPGSRRRYPSGSTMTADEWVDAFAAAAGVPVPTPHDVEHCSNSLVSPPTRPSGPPLPSPAGSRQPRASLPQKPDSRPNDQVHRHLTNCPPRFGGTLRPRRRFAHAVTSLSVRDATWGSTPSPLVHSAARVAGR